MKECFFLNVGDKYPYRIHGWFNGTCGTTFDEINNPDVEG